MSENNNVQLTYEQAPSEIKQVTENKYSVEDKLVVSACVLAFSFVIGLIIFEKIFGIRY